MMKIRLIGISMAIVCALSLCGGAVAQGGFAGRWKLDPARSEGLPPGMRQTMNVEQEGDKLKLQTKVMTEQGEQTVDDSYNLDGREADFAPPGPGGQTGKGRRTSRRAPAGGIEVEEQATFNSPDGPLTIKIKRRWKLLDDNTLLIEMTVDSPEGQQLLKRTFVRD